MCHMKAYDKALSLLAVREHTAKEIREKLLNRGYGDEEVDDAISRLLEEGAIDDARYVESYVRSRIRKGGESVRLMSLRLRERGVAKEALDVFVKKYGESPEYFEALKKNYGALLLKKGEEGAIRSLMNKGYTLSEIRRAQGKN